MVARPGTADGTVRMLRAMHGLMQDVPLVIPHLFDRAETLWSKKEVVTSLPDGRHRYTYGDWADRTRRLGGDAPPIRLPGGGEFEDPAFPLPETPPRDPKPQPSPTVPRAMSSGSDQTAALP